MENLAEYWLSFAYIEQLGSVFIKRVFDYFGSPKAAWCAAPDELYLIENLTRKQIDYFISARKNIVPEERLDFILNKGIKFINYTDPDYPALLKQIPNPPMTLFYKGDLSRCNFNRTLSVVGSRKASYNAKEELSKIISQFAGTDICIVSGLASGIDSQAHISALDNGLKTIGVIASGLNFFYPSNNKYLYEKIEDGNGAVISEYFPTFEPLKFRFPQRNRIVSGLSYGTLVVEASLKSGALITANLTLEQGRELMCMPGLISNPNTEGIYKLLKNGATLVTSADDILEALNWAVEKNEVQKELPLLQDDEMKVFNALEIEEKSFDELLSLTKLKVENLLTCLTTMELKGIIKQVDSDRYKKV